MTTRLIIVLLAILCAHCSCDCWRLEGGHQTCLGRSPGFPPVHETVCFDKPNEAVEFAREHGMAICGVPR